MNERPDPWTRLADAARAGRTDDQRAAETNPPGWWPELQSRIRPVFIRLLWRRWALGLALAAVALFLAGMYFTGRGDDASTASPTLPIPQVP